MSEEMVCEYTPEEILELDNEQIFLLGQRFLFGSNDVEEVMKAVRDARPRMYRQVYLPYLMASELADLICRAIVYKVNILRVLRSDLLFERSTSALNSTDGIVRFKCTALEATDGPHFRATPLCGLNVLKSNRCSPDWSSWDKITIPMRMSTVTDSINIPVGAFTKSAPTYRDALVRALSLRRERGVMLMFS